MVLRFELSVSQVSNFGVGMAKLHFAYATGKLPVSSYPLLIKKNQTDKQ